MRLFLTLLFAVLSSSPLYADSPSTAVDAPILLWIILDEQQPETERLAALEDLKRAAESGDHRARCTLGRLYVGGAARAARLPSFDPGDPGAWLSRCVVGGDLDAMLVMAERMLAERKPLDAMIWTQAYLKLAAALAPDTVNSAAAYKAGLLARIERAYGGERPGNEEVLEYVAGFLSQFGDRIAKGVQAGGMASFPQLLAWAQIDPKARRNSLAGRFTRDSSAAEDELVFATFLIEVDPEGKPVKVMAFEAYPDERAAKVLRGHALSRRYLPGQGPRWSYLPVYLDNKSIDLLPAAERNRRPPG